VLADVALCVTAVGVVAAVFGLRQSYRERLRQFEAMYVQRYWAILDRLSLDALGSSAVAHPGEEDEKAIRAYLLLCEDELEMRARGYIADSTYKIWAEGIRAQLRQGMFADIWQRVSGEATFPYEHLAELCTPEDQPYDPLSAGPCWRWIRGLAGMHGV
jgi:hypothetical protein